MIPSLVLADNLKTRERERERFTNSTFFLFNFFLVKLQLQNLYILKFASITGNFGCIATLTNISSNVTKSKHPKQLPATETNSCMSSKYPKTKM